VQDVTVSSAGSTHYVVEAGMSPHAYVLFRPAYTSCSLSVGTIPFLSTCKANYLMVLLITAAVDCGRLYIYVFLLRLR
jgi:hypothetical protein